MEVGKPQMEKLSFLFEGISKGITRLPDFQRDFRWEAGQITELIVTLLRGYPAGNLLFLEEKEDPFIKSKLFEGISQEQVTEKYLVLDGQQRLTSLFQALKEISELDKYVHIAGNKYVRFFIDLEKLENEEYDECVEYFSKRKIGMKNLEDISAQINSGFLPLNILFDDDKIEKWIHRYARQKVVQDTKPEELTNNVLDIVADFKSKFLNEGKPLWNVRNYEFPIVYLPQTLDEEAVCVIFEKLNTSGAPLNIFEILTAKFYSKGINLRELWSKAKEDYEILDKNNFSKDKKDTQLAIQILKAILLRKNLPKNTEEDKFGGMECKRKNLLKMLTVEDINNGWNEVVKYFSKALELLKNEYGCPNNYYLPYVPMLTPISVLLEYVDKNLDEKENAQKKIERWYWCSVFSERYSSGTDTKSKEDVDEVIKWLRGGKEPKVIRDFSIDDLDLIYTTKGAVYKGILNIILKNKSSDFFLDEETLNTIISSEKIHIHHIFPNRWVVNNVTPETKMEGKDSIINKTFLFESTNEEIKDKSTEKYCELIREKFGEEKFKMIMESNFIPITPMLKNNFEEFKNERRNLIIEQILKLTK